MREAQKSDELLAWYDKHARVMPWRVGPAERGRGNRPDPYKVWLSEIMLQQTTVAAVRDYFLRFVEKWPTVDALASAEDADVMGEWAGLGYYARARNLLKCARQITEEYDGHFPSKRDELVALPGIGPYTAAAISSIAFDAPETVVDGNVERVMARMFAITTPLPTAKKKLTSLAEELTPQSRPGDYAQAVMDLGATVCTPKNPACGVCPWATNCEARIAGIAKELPKKLPKKEKPTRFGTVFLACREDGAWLLETRPDKGLLGGMLGWPGTDWREEAPEASAPVHANWTNLNAEVKHTFTHFHLRLNLCLARVGTDANPERGNFIPKEEFKPSDLPTVMRKAFNLASGQLEDIEVSIGED